MKYLIVAVSIVILASCAVTPEIRFNKALKKANQTAFAERPALYNQLLKRGDINEATYNEWMKGWKENKKALDERMLQIEKEQRKASEKARREWESMTPAQRNQILLQQQQMALLQQQMEWERQQAQTQARRNAINTMRESLYMMQQQNTPAYNPYPPLNNPTTINVYPQQGPHFQTPGYYP